MNLIVNDLQKSAAIYQVSRSVKVFRSVPFAHLPTRFGSYEQIDNSLQ